MMHNKLRYEKRIEELSELIEKTTNLENKELFVARKKEYENILHAIEENG